MSIDVTALLQPISDDNPVGPDLDYDPDRDRIRSIFQTGYADDEVEKPDVNWRDLIALIEDQLRQSKDIWLPVYLMRAGAMMGQLDTVCAGAQLLAGLLERYWHTIHPQLEELGLPGRITPCSSLSKLAEFLTPLKRIVLVSHPRLGNYSGIDLERFDLNRDAEPDFGMFRAAVSEIDQEDLLAIVEKLVTIQTSLRQVDSIFAAHAEGDGPNFQPTYAAIDHIRRNVAVYAGAELVDESLLDTAENSIQTAPNATLAEQGLGGRIESRDDVLRALDAIADYYRRKEPSSPVPVALQRAREWVALDFLAILNDIAPNSMDDVKRVLVFTKEQPNGWSE